MKHLFNVTQEWFEYGIYRYYKEHDEDETVWRYGDSHYIVDEEFAKELEAEYQKLKENGK